ncbi:hypothetical protein HN018_00300 [Lichenicola cladoniae]|jgi:hypothetical protein|uniref:Lipoprotein n=1 Tax=Lichenicola cladoniae TaxID=1484109 RepID=A0A6M8HE58_9PROT|nr:hypothetical protein [Lichenicola cladoniae]NPD66756.1 hypothetical protein [Acetobacteraceae bacterium]QKE88700.1 hypothetical protein HN018_00300 [Lichenicola cladoniae]
MNRIMIAVLLLGSTLAMSGCDVTGHAKPMGASAAQPGVQLGSPGNGAP